MLGREVGKEWSARFLTGEFSSKRSTLKRLPGTMCEQQQKQSSSECSLLLDCSCSDRSEAAEKLNSSESLGELVGLATGRERPPISSLHN